MSQTTHITTLPLADDVMDAVARWQGWLRFEKRAAAHTVASYQFDLNNLFGFLNRHYGKQITLAMLAALTLGDFRSWLAYNAGENRQAASRARAVAGVRNFFRWLDRSGQLHNNAIDLLKLPKTSRRLPRPVTEIEAQDIMTLSKNVPHENWIGLRDEALFTLLYGAGLRIGEALALTQADLADPERITVTGKGNKQRTVPLLPIVSATLERYLKACPYSIRAGQDLRKAPRSSPRLERSNAKACDASRGVEHHRARIGLGHSNQSQPVFLGARGKN